MIEGTFSSVLILFYNFKIIKLHFSLKNEFSKQLKIYPLECFHSIGTNRQLTFDKLSSWKLRFCGNKIPDCDRQLRYRIRQRRERLKRFFSKYFSVKDSNYFPLLDILTCCFLILLCGLKIIKKKKVF